MHTVRLHLDLHRSGAPGLQLISDFSTQAAQAVAAPDSLAALEFRSVPPDRFGPGIHSSGPEAWSLRRLAVRPVASVVLLRI
jgi:hypothetical protein